MDRRRAPSTHESLKEYARGVGGGFLFSIPLLYTMEVWWAGFTATPLRLLAALGATFLLLCAYNAYAGLRYDSSAAEIVVDSVEELGLGLVLALGVLALLGRITFDTAPDEILGKVLIEGMFVAIGVSVGTAQIANDGRDRGSPAVRSQTVGGEVALAFCGAVLIAANVGATEEVLMIAAEARPWHLLGLVAASFALGALLLYFSDFRGSRRFAQSRDSRTIAEGMAITYAVALVASAAILWFFGRFDQSASVMIVAQTVVLALPSTAGAAVGRLLLR